MHSVFERVARLNQENLEVSRRFVLAACSSFDEWMKAQMDANRELMQGNVAGLTALRDNGVPVAFNKLPAAYQRYWQRTVESARDCAEAGMRTQSAFAEILFDQAGAANDAIRQIADDAGRPAPASDTAHQRARERPRQAA